MRILLKFFFSFFFFFLDFIILAVLKRIIIGRDNYVIRIELKSSHSTFDVFSVVSFFIPLSLLGFNQIKSK